MMLAIHPWWSRTLRPGSRILHYVENCTGRMGAVADRSDPGGGACPAHQPGAGHNAIAPTRAIKKWACPVGSRAGRSGPGPSSPVLAGRPPVAPAPGEHGHGDACDAEDPDIARRVADDRALARFQG